MATTSATVPPPKADLLDVLLAATRATAGSDREAACAALVEAARTQTGARAAALWVCNPQSGELWLKVPMREPLPRLEPGAGLAGLCAREGHPLRIDDPSASGDALGALLIDPVFAAQGGAVLCVPLLCDTGVLGVLELLHPQPAGFDSEAVRVSELFAAQLVLALRRTDGGGVDDPASTLRSEVEVAREIQIRALPSSMPTVPGYDLHGHFQPATYAGGDMLDAVQLPAGVFLLLGDATGHGFGPALSAMEMQGMLRVALRLGANLDAAFQHVNNQLAEDLADDRFITAFMGFLDVTAHTIQYHCAGQGPLLHYHCAEDRCEWLPPTTYPVGVMELAEAPTAATLHIGEGDILALISDGLYERIDARNTEFGMERVATVIRAGQLRPMAELCQRLLAAAEAFAGGVAATDDVTMILVRRLAGTAAPGRASTPQ